MKNSIIAIVLLSIVSFVACNKSDNDENSSIQNDENPLVGAWLLINGQYYSADRDSLIGEVNNPQQPSQIKVFSNDYFAYVSRGEDGLNTAGSAGPYRIEGNTIIETHDWSSYEIAIGATSTYEFRIVGDTLFVSGPVTSVFSDGEDWDDHIQMDEIRIRAK